MLRSQSNVIDKYFREYFDYQDELARLESEAENQTIFAQVEESPTVKRIRQELMAIIAKQKRIEEKLTKLVNSAKGMKGFWLRNTLIYKKNTAYFCNKPV